MKITDREFRKADELLEKAIFRKIKETAIPEEDFKIILQKIESRDQNKKGRLWSPRHPGLFFRISSAAALVICLFSLLFTTLDTAKVGFSRESNRETTLNELGDAAGDFMQKVSKSIHFNYTKSK